MSKIDVSELGDCYMPLWEKNFDTLSNAYVVLDPQNEKIFAVIESGSYVNSDHIAIEVDPCVDGDSLMAALQSSEARELIEQIFDDPNDEDVVESLESLLAGCECRAAVEDIDDWDFDDAWPGHKTIDEAAKSVITFIHSERDGDGNKYCWIGSMHKQLLNLAMEEFEADRELSDTQLDALVENNMISEDEADDVLSQDETSGPSA